MSYDPDLTRERWQRATASTADGAERARRARDPREHWRRGLLTDVELVEAVGVVETARVYAQDAAEIERIEQEQAERDVAWLGIVGAVRYWQHEQREAAIHDACLVEQFADDPITRSASFDAFEMAGLTSPIRARCAGRGCPLCLDAIAELAPRQRAW